MIHSASGFAMSDIRFFISYSRKDRQLAKRVEAALLGLGHDARLDEALEPGLSISPEISEMIARSHVFVPILTEHSQVSAWVQQEIGYARRSGVVVLPVATRGIEPDQMIGGLKAIVDDGTGMQVKASLQKLNLETILTPPPEGLLIGEVARSPEERVKLLGHEAGKLERLGEFGVFRQLGALSSFSIPDERLSDPVWRKREGLRPRSRYYHRLQRLERQAFEVHARHRGFKLVIFPSISLSKKIYPVIEDLIKAGHLCSEAAREVMETARKTRLATLAEFLQDARDLNPAKRQVRISQSLSERNLTIVGSWFMAESRRPKRGGYEQTIINRQPLSVLEAVAEFDAIFEEIGSSLEYEDVIDLLQDEIREA